MAEPVESTVDEPTAGIPGAIAVTEKITVSPAEFSFVEFDAAEIGEIVARVAESLHVSNPIRVEIDQTTPLGRVIASIDGTSSDALITIRAESGALEDSRRPTHFGPERTAMAIGRMLLRARDRMRPDFTGVAPDQDLSIQELAAWDAYCAGRLARLGHRVNEQRWRYNYRNRFGFSDDTDAAFDRLFAAEDLSWAEVLAP